MAIAQQARNLKTFGASLDAPYPINGETISIGGKALLEGLAQASQTHSVDFNYGADEVYAVSREFIQRHPPESPYRAIELVSHWLGCSKSVGDKQFAVNSGLAGALFITALCGRFYGPAQNPRQSFSFLGGASSGYLKSWAPTLDRSTCRTKKHGIWWIRLHEGSGDVGL